MPAPWAAVGVDHWSTTDQSGNAEQVTRENAALEGVADRVELHTADMRKLPFDDGSFDVVVSSLAIHNVSGAGERARALSEAARVLKKDGKLAIVNIRYARVRQRARGLRAEDHRSPLARRALPVRSRPLGGDRPGRRGQAVDKAKPRILPLR